MIRPDGFRAAAFGTAEDGDGRRDQEARALMSRALGIPAGWATVDQVHGATTVVAAAPGHYGEADAILATSPMVPIAIGTADCLPIVIEGGRTVAVVHAGWRGLVAGVIESALGAMSAAGDEPRLAAIGPAIGPCCYEVGDDVASRFPGFVAETTWGAPSVDLKAVAAATLAGVEVWVSPLCTMTDPGLNSHRGDGTKRRQVAVAWLPKA